MVIDQDVRECTGCGSTLRQRIHYKNQADGDEEVSTSLSQCPHCQAYKCCMCDQGDDAECVACDTEKEIS